MKNIIIRRTTVAALAAAVSLGLAACGDDSDSAATTSAAAASDTSSANASTDPSDQAEAGALVLKDGYVGAKDTSKSMTAVFGDLTNTTDKDIHLTRVTGTMPGVYQYHEVVNGVMRETEDGLIVPANGSVHMAPGGHHIMIMENNENIAAGDALTLTLTDEEGKTYELTDIGVRVQQSGHEDYGSGDADNMGDMGDMKGDK